MTKKDEITSISPQIFYILLALSLRERHGYDIMKQVESDTNGKVRLGPGTLYGAIKRMLEDKLIIAVKSEDPRRKFYKLTQKGRSLLTNEVQRYNEALEIAKQRDLLKNITGVKLAYV